MLFGRAGIKWITDSFSKNRVCLRFLISQHRCCLSKIVQSSPQWQHSYPLLSRDNFVRSGPVQSVALWQYGRIGKILLFGNVLFNFLTYVTLEGDSPALWLRMEEEKKKISQESQETINILKHCNTNSRKKRCYLIQAQGVPKVFCP